MGDVALTKNQRFELGGRLGTGGMGVVYRAFDREIGRHVALKLLPQRSADAVLRFKKEFQALQDIHHPNLVSLGELFVEDGQWFLTMELVEGVDFFADVRRSAIPRPFHPTTRSPISGVDETVDVRSISEDDKIERPFAPPSPFDEARLRGSLLQVVQALHALHAAGKVHRDIKPSNILVTSAGRAVVLDFGLAEDTRAVTDGEILGTVDYMAPEQIRGGAPLPASDWYSLGVMLYEVLTGSVPFVGPAFRVLSEKQHYDPPHPHEIEPSLPKDLADLAMDLLQRDASRRPSAHEILRRLGGAAPAEPDGAPDRESLFIGREEEMEILEQASRDVRAGRSVTVLVKGASGIGKSALVRHFARKFALRPSAVVLSGRCYERASVPYKALDGVMDSLSVYLRGLPPEETVQVLAPDAPMLPQVFPVLGRVAALGLEPAPSQRILDKHELRARVFAAARETIGNLGRRGPLLVAIDDLQWTDEDSVALLAEIMRPPDAPPLLLVATMRAAADTGPRVSIDLPGEVRAIDLEPLPISVASALAEKLIRDAGSDDEAPPISVSAARTIAAEAGGHPMFIDELVRHAREQSGALRTDLRLDDALRARVAGLAEAEQQVLDVVAVAGAPIKKTAAAAAAGLDKGDFAEALATLRAQHLVRTSGAQAEGFVEPYHDRVREAVSAALEPSKKGRIHGAIAAALESEGADPEALVLHYMGAGMRKNAARCALAAAERALVSLAFDRAARLFALTLEQDPDRADAREIRVAEGDARANAGRGAEAADLYLRAAEGAPPDLSRDLTRRAAEQLLRTGHVERGIETLDRVLVSLGLGLPKSRGRLIASLLWHRARFAFRGVKFVRRTEDQISPEDLARIDATWSGAIGLAMVDPVQAAQLEVQNCLLALQAGEPFRIARALALETTFLDTENPKDPSRRNLLLSVAEPLAREVQNPYAQAYVIAAQAERNYNTGLYAAALPKIEESVSVFRDRCTGAQWEAASMNMYVVATLFYIGRFADLCRLVPRLVSDAHGRSDVFSAAVFRTGLASSHHLAAGRPDIAEREADDAASRWSGTGFQVQHYYHLLAISQAAIYAGEPERAVERIDAAWKPFEKSLLTRVQTVRMEATFLHGRALAAAARRAQDKDARSALHKRLKATAKRLAAEQAHHATPLFAALLFAAADALAGDAKSAEDRLTDAEKRFAALEMKLFAAGARRARGVLAGGDEGQSLVRSAEALFAEEGIASPARFANLLVPGF